MTTRRAWVTCAAALGALCVSLWATPAGAQTVINGNSRFTANPTCTTSPCVLISGPGARVDGRGFVVDCGGTVGVGVQISAPDVTLVNLTVRNCTLNFVVAAASSGVTLRRNRSENASNIGFRIFGDDALVVQNVSMNPNFEGAGGFVVDVGGDNAVLRENRATDGFVGIQLYGSSNSVLSNTVQNASLYGIVVELGSTFNDLLRNTASGSGSLYDLVDINTDCDSNNWSNNDGRASQSCVQ